jgi:hypothetical protein
MAQYTSDGRLLVPYNTTTNGNITQEQLNRATGAVPGQVRNQGVRNNQMVTSNVKSNTAPTVNSANNNQASAFQYPTIIDAPSNTQSFGDLNNRDQWLLGQYGTTADQFNVMNREGQDALLGHSRGMLTPLQENQALQSDYLRTMIDDAQGTDWLGWSNVGLGGLDLAMKIPQYNKYNDYMDAVISNMDQNMELAQQEAAHRDEVRQNYSSAFSNASA